MNTRCAKDVKNLSLNEKERLYNSRNRLGFHVFLSRFIDDFRKLSLLQQRLKIYNEININLFPPDDVSIDSTSSMINEKVHHKFVMKLACKYWSHLYNNKMKNAWKDRAIILNSRKLPGKFVSIPNDIKGELNDHIMNSLTYEWKKLMNIMKNSITKPPKRTLASLTYKFGKELVKLQSQSYRDMQMSYLLELTIFGKDKCNLKQKEIIYKTKKIMIVNIASKQRFDMLFVKEDCCATEFSFGSSGIITACGKINIMRNGKNILGYILEETKMIWKIILKNDQLIWLDAPKYCKINHRYIFKQKKGMIITMYWPIRILIRQNGGGCKITLNRVAYTYNKRGKIKLQHQYCS